MSSEQKIKEAFNRSVKALSLKPSLGFDTRISKARITDGLSCEITEGNWKLMADMPAAAGGNGSAPTPGVYGRAALGSCLAIAYKMYAVKMNIPIDALEIEVQADFDDGGLFGTSTTPAGYTEVRYIITVKSNAGEDEILKWLDEADKHSPYLDVFSRGQKCVRKVNIVSTQKQ